MTSLRLCAVEVVEVETADPPRRPRVAALLGPVASARGSERTLLKHALSQGCHRFVRRLLWIMDWEAIHPPDGPTARIRP